MEDQYGQTPEDYVYDLKILSDRWYAVSYSIVLEATAEAFSSHCHYFDAI